MHIGDIVELTEGNEDFYLGVLPESMGIIKDRKTDDEGFELFYIEWSDEEYEDGWTFASHFRIVQKDGDVIASFENQEENATDQYINEITEAFDDVSESEGFMTLSISRVVNPDNEVVYLMPRIHMLAATKEANMAIEAQIIQMASDIYANAVDSSLRDMEE